MSDRFLKERKKKKAVAIQASLYITMLRMPPTNKTDFKLKTQTNMKIARPTLQRKNNIKYNVKLFFFN